VNSEYVLVSFGLVSLCCYLSLYPPSERSETGGYTVFTSCVSVSVSVRPSVSTHLDANISKTDWDRGLVPITR